MAILTFRLMFIRTIQFRIRHYAMYVNRLVEHPVRKN